MTEKYTKDDLLTANQFAKKHQLDKEDVELAMKKLRGLMIAPPKRFSASHQNSGYCRDW